ncbi:3-carboxy-cis,cis-muconate cycloisomerase [Haliscomenobacter hydrossis]|uniref:3-carboxy-cis,cis-muconate cycloisomerase n=1 Tax=Haliscomenobacter hydrossis (strain ATCC 27775 / DSM 1100 / LMG 10767 / O) TaxID=760192 RepID=F4L195_HALH1|nr:3-carboxy-cis,cis-muconate cycloisomerase [Haliscomenobacter hydrossis]AEE52827.1 3-carboxy-cis,cis-muconate cycloisomerase [Haliscomenobacter hydrossis DSM 1100]
MESLFESLFYKTEANTLFSAEAYLEAMLRFEAALAQAEAEQGMIPVAAAQAITEACAAPNLDMVNLKLQIGLAGNPNIPLVKQLTAAVKKIDPEAAKFVHLGATSQDVMDTAMVLQLKAAVLLMQKDLKQLLAQLRHLAEEHRHSIMVGRSFMQHARPITFGFKVVTWLDGLIRSAERLEYNLQHNLVLQFGGAVGTLAGFGEKSEAIAQSLAEKLDVTLPHISWHTQRDRLVELASTLGILSGNLGKIAKDISLLMQTEIGEVFEPAGAGKGGSSTMPHKRNPVGCVAILAAAQRMPALVAALLQAMPQDHERATGLWHAEWLPLVELCKVSAGALQQALVLTNGLEVDTERMRQNLELTRGLIFAENISLALADKVGKATAHEWIEALCQTVSATHTHLKIIVLADSRIQALLSKTEIEQLFDPANALGECDRLIDGVLATF